MNREIIDELRRKISLAKSPSTQAIIESAIQQIEKKPNSQNTEAKAEPISTSKDGATPVIFSDIKKYAWDQSSKSIKIYFDVSPVDGHELKSPKLQATSDKVDFQVTCGARVHRLLIHPLSKSINSEMASYKTKDSGTVVLTLPKPSSEHWTELKAKPMKANSSGAPNFDKDADPQANLMSMMKNMYEEGDDDMKRTIAKAWTEGQQKSRADEMNLN